MYLALDSATPPNDAQCEAARTAGFKGWFGYFAGPKIMRGWSRPDFDRVRSHSLRTLAYCSGWADAHAMRQQSAEWGVPIALDAEGSIRDVGPWTQTWLKDSEAGLYGGYWVHPKFSAPVHINTGGLWWRSGGAPAVTWPTNQPAPATPHGWQSYGSHNFAGVTVDSGYYDDAIGSPIAAPQGGFEAMTNDEAMERAREWYDAVLRRAPESNAAQSTLAGRILDADRAGQLDALRVNFEQEAAAEISARQADKTWPA